MEIRRDIDGCVYVRENPDNLTGTELAGMFGVTPSTIRSIIHEN